MMAKNGVEKFGEHIPWEIAVQLGIKNFAKDGDCVLDIGANVGAISIAMSRLVGENGVVYAFEANPNLEATIKANLEINESHNVKLTNKAVWQNLRNRNSTKQMSDLLRLTDLMAIPILSLNV
ncbi:FkbM family methyltransferase [Heliomicrobium modesticaldum]|uniref:FkbM family methyltransferase n=1 Tax=Heliomicrobium modesticaldum TaxID=35701 RepID=UPI001650A1C9|nr:FkbM family methyltransferase [Heliomicrobium modesticaldum]